MQWVVENLQSESPSISQVSLLILDVENDSTRKLLVNDVQQFVQSAPGPVAPASLNQRVNERDPQPPAYSNPQTEAFCRMIGIENKINPGGLSGGGGIQ
jgi:lariat debranching enzyme